MRPPREPNPLGKAFERPSASVEVELITPLFGGGVEPRRVTPDDWLRSAAVRGALRFWWRALHAHEFATINELRDKESALFGSAAVGERGGPGSIAVTVTTVRKAKRDDHPYKPQPGDALNVAYFAAAPMGQEAAHLALAPEKERATAKIELAANTEQELTSAKQALVLWLLFGGAGARTRRGAGAVTPTSIEDAHKGTGHPRTLEELVRFLQDLPRDSGSDCHGIFAVADRVGIYWGDPQQTATSAHKRLLSLWRDVRQDRKHPPSWTGPRDWGMSEWPEVDLIRRAENKWSSHPHHAPRSGQTAALRPHFGLPLGIKFKDEKNDPKKNEILPAGEDDRYGSPVWLGLSRVKNGYVPVVLITQSRLVGPLKYRERLKDEIPLGLFEKALARLTKVLNEYNFTEVKP